MSDCRPPMRTVHGYEVYKLKTEGHVNKGATAGARRISGGVSCRGRSVDTNRQGRGWRLAQIGQTVLTLGNTGLSWGKARSGARSSSLRRKSGVPSHAQEDPGSEASLQEGQGGGRPRGCQLPFALWGWYLAFPQRFGH